MTNVSMRYRSSPTLNPGRCSKGWIEARAWISPPLADSLDFYQLKLNRVEKIGVIFVLQAEIRKYPCIRKFSKEALEQKYAYIHRNKV